MKIILSLYLIVISLGVSAAQMDQEPTTLIIFGSTGDLSSRKLFPALYNLSQGSENVSIIGIGRQNLNDHEFHDIVYHSLQKFSTQPLVDETWDLFKKNVTYHKADFDKEEGYKTLKDHLDLKKGNYIFYLATDSAYFSTIIHQLSQSGLIKPKDGSRVVIEKPFGRDLNSSIKLQASISQFLDEKQIFRMDHYLGKEGVHKLLKFRFEDQHYDSLFNEKYVDSIDITLSETIGIGTRANFYENTGHLRDVIQNHAMQLLALAAMDPPESSSPEDILKEKASVLSAIRPIPKDAMNQYVMRGQYAAGIIQGELVPGYLEEEGVPKSSHIETFVQMKLFIDNDRWNGVPIMIISGKRLPEQLTQIVFNLKANPFDLEKMTIVIQPDPQIYLHANNESKLYPITVDPSFSGEAYENLLLAAIQGDRSHFVTIDEVLSTWSLLTPVLESWSHPASSPIPLYEAGTWGPQQSIRNIQ